MSTFFFRLALAVLMSVSVLSGRALADEIAIDSADYAKLPADQQKQLVTEMKKKGLLAEEDSVKNKAKPAAETAESTLVLTLVPSICSIIAGKKKSEELAKCASKKTPEAQAECTTAAESKFGTIGAVCGAIKLF